MYHKQGNCNGQYKPELLGGVQQSVRVVLRDCSLADAVTRYGYPMSVIDKMVKDGKAELYAKAGKRYVRIYS